MSYSNKIQTILLNRFTNQLNDSDEQILFIIKRFNELKDKIRQKVKEKDPIILENIPKYLQHKNKYLDITQYQNYKDLKTLVQLCSNKEVDIYDNFLQFWIKKYNFLDIVSIESYIERFKSAIPIIENQYKSYENALYSCSPRLIKNNNWKIISEWNDWFIFENFLDKYFPIINNINTENSIDSLLVYETENFRIYKSQTHEDCQKLSKGYSWCIGHSNNSNYINYRINNDITFYFVQDDNLPPNDPFYRYVIHKKKSGKFAITPSQNGDSLYDTYDNIFNLLRSKGNNNSANHAWNRIKDLEHIFVDIKIKDNELFTFKYRNKLLKPKEFLQLSENHRLAYLTININNNTLLIDLLKYCTLKEQNALIDLGYIFSDYKQLKSNKLISRFARISLSKGNFINPIFYKDCESKDQIKYINKNLEKFSLKDWDVFKKFHSDSIQWIINRQLSYYDFIHPDFFSYMNKEQKNKYLEYYPSFLGVNSKSNSETSIYPLGYSDFIELPTNIQKRYIDLLLSISTKESKLYSNVLLGAPLFLKKDKDILILFNPNNIDRETILYNYSQNKIEKSIFVMLQPYHISIKYKNNSLNSYDNNTFLFVSKNENFILEYGIDFDSIELIDKGLKRHVLF